MIKRLTYLLLFLLLSSPFVLSQTVNSLNTNWYVSDTQSYGTNSTVNIPTTTTVRTDSSNLNLLPTTIVSIANLPLNVQNTITTLTAKYNLTPAQINAVSQISRSYQYIINNVPTSQAQALELNRRDVSSLNCASSRIPSNYLDDIVYQVETSSLDTQSKRNAYEYYSSFLLESNNSNSISGGCEDAYSGTNVNTNTNTSTNVITNTTYNPNIKTNTTVTQTTFDSNFTGIVPDDNITTKCTVLTQFLSFGSKGSQVLALQNFLMDNGYLEMYPTGFYGRNTEAGVLEWQRRHNIDQRGYVGPNTRASIASITCRGDRASINRAFNGVVYTAPAAKVVKTTSTTKTNTVKVSQPVKTEAATDVVIATTTETTTYVTDTYTQNTQNNSTSLSTSGGTFFLRRSPINTLYFSFKANTSRDAVFYCIENTQSANCKNTSSFNQISERYDAGNIDFINNSDRWLVNVYYDPSKWSGGGKIYFRNGLGNISEVYTVSTRDTN